MNEKKQLTKQLIVVVIMNIAAIGIYALFSRGIMRVVAEYKTTLEQQSRAQKKEQALLDVKKELDSLSSDRRIIDSLFVSKDQVAAFVEQIESTAFASELPISINTLRIDQIEGRDALHVDYTVKGSFSSIGDQMGRLDDLPYIIDVKTVSLARGQETAGWTAQVALSLRSYFSQ